LGWCSIFNMALLFLWFLFMLIAHDWVYRMHSALFHIPKVTFYEIHYGGMLLYKLAIWFFNIIPYFVLRRINNS